MTKLLERGTPAGIVHSAGRDKAEYAVVVSELRRTFGTKIALDGATFRVRSGTVTGFLGPNGAGKTTALRIILGLDYASSGEALVLGKRFKEMDEPGSHVGALLDSSGFHPLRSARNHLLAQADLLGVAKSKVDHALDVVDLSGDAERLVGGFSLGMKRRLGLACAMLGEPSLLILDEPSNGLDPAGVRWLRNTLREFVDQGGTVFISSHALAEVAQVADDLVVINHGAVVAQIPVKDLEQDQLVTVGSSEMERLEGLLVEVGSSVVSATEQNLQISGTTAADVGRIAAAAGIPLSHLSCSTRTLEEMFFSLTEDAK